MITAQRKNGINEPLGHSCVNLANLSKARHFTVYLENPHACASLFVTLHVIDRNGRDVRDVEQEHWKFSLLANCRQDIQHWLLFDNGRCTFILSAHSTPLYDLRYVLQFHFLSTNGQVIQTHRTVIRGRGHSYEPRHRNDYAASTVLLCPNFGQQRAIFEPMGADLAAAVYPAFQI